MKKSLVGVLKETEETRSFFLNLALLIAVRFFSLGSLDCGVALPHVL